MGDNKSINLNTTDPGMMPISIINAASMLRRSLKNNELPYTQAMYINNNKLVDEWYEQVLLNISNKSGNIRAGQVWVEWQYFYNGKIIPQFIEHLEKGLVCRPCPKAIDYWVDIFSKKDISQLAAMGPAVVGHGWKLITDEVFIRNAINKWEKIYKHSDLPLEWRKLAHENASLMAVDFENPFWSQEVLSDITQKVLTVLKIAVTPVQ